MKTIRVLWLMVGAVLVPSSAGQVPDTARAQDRAVARVQAYLRVDTVNPPGNEVRGVEFFRKIFEAEGVPYETAESAPGRGNIWARLDGGPEPGLILLHHMDVVPADPKYWSVDPLSGTERQGYLYGRGALDTKTLGILHLEAFLALHREGRSLRRPVLFMATADEEAGGFQGAGWLAEKRPELFRDFRMLLNEGGGAFMANGKAVFEIEVTQKVPLWLRLIVRDVPGHGSQPRATSSVVRLIHALEKLANHSFEPRIVPAVASYFKGRAAAGIGPFQDRIGSIAEVVRDPAFLTELQRESPLLAAITRNTCSVTRLEGSAKINVIPPQASAEVDCRLLPDENPERFVAQLHGILSDPGIEVQRIMAFTPAVSSTDTELYRTLVRVTAQTFKGAVALPAVASGFTDSHFFRDLGIDCYGFSPLISPAGDLAGMHGNDERVPVESIRRGVLVMQEIVRAIAHEPR